MPNWAQVLEQLQTEQIRGQQDAVRAQARAMQAFDTVRRTYLQQLFGETHRNTIAYYSGFLSKPDRSDINDEDKNGFMMAVHRLKPRFAGLDLILHTPGGNIASTQSIVDYLHRMFGNDIRAIIPQMAMSAGTMMACSCREIVMGKQSNLGPIDPHLNGVPAYGVISEFEEAYKEIKGKKDTGIDHAKVLVWQPIISQYKPTFLSQCRNAISLSNQFVEEQLATVMFGAEKESLAQTKKQKADAKRKARQIVKRLTDYTENRRHDRHIHIEECKKIGLRVVELEAKGNEQFQDLVLTIHHCYMHALMNSSAYKIIENHLGDAFVKHSIAAARMSPRSPSPPAGWPEPSGQ
jgi:hypothetical protein